MTQTTDKAAKTAKRTASKRSKGALRVKALRGGTAMALVTLSSFAVYRAVGATATMDIVARIVRAIEVTVNTSINFGTLAVTADSAGAAVLDPLTNELMLSGQGGVNLAGGTPQAGRLRIKGAAMPVQISLDTNNIQLTNGTTFLTVNAFNFQTPNGGPQATVTPAGPGDSVTLTLGATLNTRPRQLTGTYIGSNKIFANYQ